MLRFSCLMFLIGCFTIFAAVPEISLKGTVKDGSSAAVAGAKVTLVNQPTISTTTDAQGEFTLQNTGIAVPYSISVKNSSKIGIRGNNIQFSISTEAKTGSIEIFSTNGRRNALISLGKLQTGTHCQALPTLAPGFYVLNINIDNSITTLSLLNSGSNLYINGIESSPLAKGTISNAALMAAVDTLVVTKSGYDDAKVAVDSYSKTGINVTLNLKATPTCPTVTLPAANAITYSNAKTPDPMTFKYMNLPKVTTKAQWECRRQEIYEMAQTYLYGHMPAKPDSVWGTVSSGTITVNCKKGSKSVNFSVNKITGSGDILVIDFGGGAPAPANSRKADLMSQSSWTADMVGTIKNLYGSTDVGQCMAGSWAVGRIIDVLEQNPNSGIDPKKVITTGCSTNGKDAFIAGVFEPRVAICMPVESGCAGSCSWRVSSSYGHGNSNTDCQDITHLEKDWLGTGAAPWRNGTVKIDKLPLDQDEVMALRAPLPMMVFDNGKEQYKWLCNRGQTAAAQGCRWIYKALGASDNFGFYQANAGHTHCSWPSEANAAAQAYCDKFLNGKTTTNTNIMNLNSESLETSKWFDFGTGADKWDTTTVLQ